MNVWIVNPYGTLPSEGWREYRSAMLARALSSRGHNVTWWLSDFEHRTKTRRSRDVIEPTLPGVSIRCLDAGDYQANISFGRIRYERAFGQAFAEQANNFDAPDIIVLGEPALFFGGPVQSYAKKNRVKLVVDVLDLWPELFHIVLPKPLQRFGRLIFRPLYERRTKLIAASDGVAAVTGDYAATVLKDVRSKPSDVFYLGVDTADFPEPVPSANDDLTVMYAGTLGEAYDIDTLVQAITLLAPKDQRYKFIIAGAGPKAADVAALARTYPDQIEYLGSVTPEKLLPHYGRADVGLCTYAPGSTVSMPVKLYDYLAAGLFVVSSLGGEIRDLLRDGAGAQYKAGAPEDLAATLEQLIQSPELLARGKAEARQLGMRFDQGVQHMRYVDFLETIVEGTG